jgi:hypothetical protein
MDTPLIERIAILAIENSLLGKGFDLTEAAAKIIPQIRHS